MARPLVQQQLTLPWGGGRQLARDEILARYLHLREISKRLHHEILGTISSDALLHQARRLGFVQGKTVILEHEDEAFYVYDLAIYTAPPDRSRAVDRYARSAGFEAGSDERLMLEAMQASQFALLAIEGRHDIAGVVAKDVVRNSEVWLLDVGLESSLDQWELLATRLITPGPFSMTAGVNVPFGIEMLESACSRLPQRVAADRLDKVVDDRRFAEAIYKAGLADGVMDRLGYLDLQDSA